MRRPAELLGRSFRAECASSVGPSGPPNARLRGLTEDGDVVANGMAELTVGGLKKNGESLPGEVENSPGSPNWWCWRYCSPIVEERPPKPE